MSLTISLNPKLLDFNTFGDFRRFLENFLQKSIDRIQFQDDEGDVIRITSDLELKEALKVAKTIGLLQLTVFYDEPKPVEVSAPQASREPVLEPVPEPAPVSETVPPVPEHVPIHHAICDSCDVQIRGIRYKCSNCPDFDLCEKCEASHPSQPKHNPDHIFFKIYKPIRAANLYSQRRCPYLQRTKEFGLNVDVGQRRHCPFISKQEEEKTESEKQPSPPDFAPQCRGAPWRVPHSGGYPCRGAPSLPSFRGWRQPYHSFDARTSHNYAARLENVEKQIEELKKLLPPKDLQKPTEDRRAYINQKQERKERKKKEKQERKWLKRTHKWENATIELTKDFPEKLSLAETPTQAPVEQNASPPVNQEEKPEVQETQAPKEELMPKVEPEPWESCDQETTQMLEILSSMGFVDKRLNFELLARFHHDLGRVIEILLSIH